MKSEKFDKAANRASGIETPEPKFDPTATPIIDKLDMREFAEAVAAGAELGERYLEMEPGDMFRAFFLGTSDGYLEEDGVRKPVVRMHFEAATRDMKGTGVTFSILEYAQLKSQISDVLQPDGSGFVIVGKGEMSMQATRKKRNVQQWIVARTPNARDPRRRLEAKSAVAGDVGK